MGNIPYRFFKRAPESFSLPKKNERLTKKNICHFDLLKISFNEPADAAAKGYLLFQLRLSLQRVICVTGYFSPPVRFDDGYFIFHSESGAPQWRSTTKYARLIQYGILLLTSSFQVILFSGAREYLFSQRVGRPPRRSTTKYAKLLQIMVSILLLTSIIHFIFFAGAQYKGIFIFTKVGRP